MSEAPQEATASLSLNDKILDPKPAQDVQGDAPQGAQDVASLPATEPENNVTTSTSATETTPLVGTEDKGLAATENSDAPAATSNDEKVEPPTTTSLPETTTSKAAPMDVTEPATVDNGSVQTEILEEQLPEANDPNEADAAQTAGRLAGVILPNAPTVEPATTTDQTSEEKPSQADAPEPLAGEKRKADDVVAEDTKDVEADAGSLVDDETSEKKIKTNDGTAAAAPQRKNSKAGRPKKAATAAEPTPGLTRRQTRSQGPVA